MTTFLHSPRNSTTAKSITGKWTVSGRLSNNLSLAFCLLPCASSLWHHEFACWTSWWWWPARANTCFHCLQHVPTWNVGALSDSWLSGCFPYTTTWQGVSCRETRAYEVVQVEAIDMDATGNAVLYSWVTSTAFFDLAPLSGSIRSKTSQRASKDSTHDLTVRVNFNSNCFNLYHRAMKGVLLTAYPFYQVDDSGSPVKSSTTRVRIDVIDFYAIGICIEFSASEGAIFSNRVGLLSGLHNSVASTRDVTNIPRLWKTETVVASDVNSQSRAFVYILDSNATDSATFISISKTFITQTVLLSLWSSDSSGTPSNILSNHMPSGREILPFEHVDAVCPVLCTRFTQAWYRRESPYVQQQNPAARPHPGFKHQSA